MNIIYEDEYGQPIFWGNSTHPANVGDSVVIDDEEFKVKSRVFYPQLDKIIVILAQSIFNRVEDDSKESGRLTKLNAAILEVSKKQKAADKQTAELNEQLLSMKKHINRNIQRDTKKD